MVRAASTWCAALAFYILAVRPRLLGWGASDDEIRAEYPGDGAVAEPHTVSTRAVTIGARPDQI
jgi:hypothetical protein